MHHSIFTTATRLVVTAVLATGAHTAFAGNVSWSVSVGSGQVYGPPPVVYVQPQPVYVQPQTVYVQPHQVYVRPAPVYVQPRQIYVQPGTVVHIGEPYYVKRKHHRKGRPHHWKHTRHAPHPYDYRY